MNARPPCAADQSHHDRKLRSVPLRIVDPSKGPSPLPSEPVVDLDEVSKEYRSGWAAGVSAITGFSLTIEANAATLITGPSGCGKTTLLSLIGCMVRPTSGRIVVAGRDVSRLPEDSLAEVRRETFGFVFQSCLLIRGTTAVDNVMLPAIPRPEVKGGLRRKAMALLDRFGLAGKGHERVEHLSGGEQQRVAIARALINDPKVIIADEPTAHLDSAATRNFLDLVEELRGEGKTVLVASHDQELLHCGRFSQVLALREGRLASEVA